MSEQNKIKERELTDLQKKFLDVLMSDEARGDIRKAMRIAGYSDSTPTSLILSSLSDEIISVAKKVLASSSTQAVFATLDVLESPGALGAANKLKAAQILLDRAGVAQEKEESVNLKVPSGGLIILPAKQKDTEADLLKADIDKDDVSP